jgi:endonuclease/exonuclease/phosphatase family metal-dependent hydrolase
VQDLRRLTFIVICLLAPSRVLIRAETVTIATWNLEWFPGRKPVSSETERIVHMSAAKDALLDLHADILCLQEVRDWDSVAELVSVLPSFRPLIVSRFREFGDSGRVTIQQIAIASRWAAESAWSESFKPSAAAPPRGFSFAAIRRGNTILLVYSAHFKSNRGDPANDIDKREEAARQLLAHTSEMETLYSKGAKVVIVIAGDFNTDPTDARFASEQTFALLRKTGFLWAWENIPLSERVTIPAKRRYPDASFDGFLVRGARVLSCEPIAVRDVSDHCPAVLSFEIN